MLYYYNYVNSCILPAINFAKTKIQYNTLIILSIHSVLANQTASKSQSFLHRCQKLFYGFYYFHKNAFLTFLFFNVFYFLMEKCVILQNLLNSDIKRLLSDGFNTAAVGNSLTKSHRLTLKRCHAH